MTAHKRGHSFKMVGWCTSKYNFYSYNMQAPDNFDQKCQHGIDFHSRRRTAGWERLVSLNPCFWKFESLIHVFRHILVAIMFVRGNSVPKLARLQHSQGTKLSQPAVGCVSPIHDDRNVTWRVDTTRNPWRDASNTTPKTWMSQIRRPWRDVSQIHDGREVTCLDYMMLVTWHVS